MKHKINTGGPAFPNRGDNTPSHPIFDGMTLRDWFAGQAPPEVPQWFEHVPASEDCLLAHPKENLLPDDAKTTEAWLRDDIVDLPDHLEWYSDALDRFYEAKDEWSRQNSMARYFQWRWFYADAMLKTREKCDG